MIDIAKIYTFVCIVDGREVVFENRTGKWMKEMANHGRNKRLYTKVSYMEKSKQIDVTAEIKH
jgi:hypothetical protein